MTNAKQYELFFEAYRNWPYATDNWRCGCFMIHVFSFSNDDHDNDNRLWLTSVRKCIVHFSVVHQSLFSLFIAVFYFELILFFGVIFTFNSSFLIHYPFQTVAKSQVMCLHAMNLQNCARLCLFKLHRKYHFRKGHSFDLCLCIRM